MRMSAWFAAAALALPLAVHAQPPLASAPVDPLDPGVATPHYGAYGFDKSGEDPLGSGPGDDFFRYANGDWLKRVDIPGDRTRFGNFDILSVLSEKPRHVHAILEQASAKALPPTDPEAKIGAAYHAFMDEPTIERLGAAPLQGDLARVKQADTRGKIAALMGDHHRASESIFGVGIGQDAKHPDRYAIQMRTGGLGLPDKGLLPQGHAALHRDPRRLQGLYRPDADPGRLVGPAGQPRPYSAFETDLARVSWDRGRAARPATRPTTPPPCPPWRRRRRGSTGRAYMCRRRPRRRERPDPHRQHRRSRQGRGVRAHARAGFWQAWLAFNIADGMGGRASRPLRPGALRVPQQGAGRPARVAGPLEAGRGPRSTANWARMSAASTSATTSRPEAKAQMLELVGNLKDRLPRPTGARAVDDAGHAAGGGEQARRLPRQDRLPRHLARLL